MPNQKPKLNFNIVFNKSDPKISAEMYAQSLISVSSIIREVNYQEGHTGNIAVNISAEKEGSFFVLLELIEQVANNQELFSHSIEALSGIVDIFVGLISIRKYLAKEEAKVEADGDNVNIVDGDGNTIYQTNNTTYNLYMGNQAIQDAISEQFNSLKDDSELDSLDIQAPDTGVKIDKQEFPAMAKKVILEIEETDEVTVEAELVVRKIVVDNPERKWEFVYQGLPISAVIRDEAFWDKILKGEVRFANGDRLVGSLTIIREFDQATNTYLNKDYVVSAVRQHHPRSPHAQTSFDTEL